MSKYSVAFCTSCKNNVNMSEVKFVKLANSMVTIQGICDNCGREVLKGRVLPKTGKNPLAKYRRKLNQKRSNVYFQK